MAGKFHTEASPSKFSRIRLCTASLKASRGIPDAPSAAAEVGTRRHQLTEYCGKARIDPVRDLPNDEEWTTYTEEDRRLAQVNLDYIRSLPGRVLCVLWEQFVDLSGFYPEAEGGVSGTVDCVVLTENDAGRRVLWVIDHKFGEGIVVDADGNEQLFGGYAPGLLRDLEPIHGEVDEVVALILQPTRDHVSECRWPRSQVFAFVRDVMRPAIAEAYGPAPTFNPSAAACQFCPARLGCAPRNAAHIAELDAALSEAPDPEAATAPQVAEALAKAATWKKWIADMESTAAVRLSAGKEVPGFKLVDGRPRRAWRDDGEASEAMVAALIAEGRDPDDAEAAVHKVSVIGIGDAEKLFGKKSPVLSSLTVTNRTSPVVVPASDPRPAMQTVDQVFPLSIEEL